MAELPSIDAPELWQPNIALKLCSRPGNFLEACYTCCQNYSMEIKSLYSSLFPGNNLGVIFQVVQWHTVNGLFYYIDLQQTSMLINLIVIITSQRICIPNHHTVHLIFNLICQLYPNKAGKEKINTQFFTCLETPVFSTINMGLQHTLQSCCEGQVSVQVLHQLLITIQLLVVISSIRTWGLMYSWWYAGLSDKVIFISFFLQIIKIVND